MHLPVAGIISNSNGGAFPVLEDWTFSNNGNISGTTILTLTKPAGIIVGEKLLLLCMCPRSTNDFTTEPAGWTEIINVPNGSALAVFERIADGTEGATINVTGATTIEKCGYYLRVSNNNSGTFDAAVQNQDSGTSHVINGVTPTVDNCLCFYAFSFDGYDGLPLGVSGTDWTEIDSDGNTAGVSASFGTQEKASAGDSGDVTITTSASDGSGCVSFSIEP